MDATSTSSFKVTGVGVCGAISLASEELGERHATAAAEKVFPRVTLALTQLTYPGLALNVESVPPLVA